MKRFLIIIFTICATPYLGQAQIIQGPAPETLIKNALQPSIIGVPGGVAPLDSTGKVPSINLPSVLTGVQIGTASGQARDAALAITAETNAQNTANTALTTASAALPSTAVGTSVVRLTSPTGAAVLAAGTTTQQPDTGNIGEVRYNSTTGRYEFGIGGAWVNHTRLSGDTLTGPLSWSSGASQTLANLGGLATVSLNQPNGPAQLDANGFLTGNAAGETIVTTASYTASTTDRDLCVSANTAVTITIPATATTGRVYTVKDCLDHAAIYPITVQVASGGLIDGYTNVIEMQNAMSLDIKFNGSTWGLR